MAKAPVQHGIVTDVMDRAQELLALDPLTRDGARELGRRRAEVLLVMDLLASREMPEEACELGLLLEQAMEQLGEVPGPHADRPSPKGGKPARGTGRFGLIEHLLGIARAAGHSYYEGELILRQAELWVAHGDDAQAAQSYAAVQELAQREQLGVLEVAALSGQAELARKDGNLFKAHSLYAKQQTLASSMGETLLLSQSLANLASTALCMGDHRRAARYARENLNLCRQMHDQQGAAEALCSLGMAQRHLGDVAEGKKSYLTALSLARELQNESLEAAVCYNLGCLLLATEAELAASLVHHARRLAREMGAATLQEACLRAAQEIEQRLTPEVLGAARREAEERIAGLISR